MKIKNIPWILTVISGVACAIAYLWSLTDPESATAVSTYFATWIIFLLALGYASTPSGSWCGKTAFLFVVVIVVGLTFKVLHFLGATEILVFGLIGLAATYAIMWVRTQRQGHA